MAKKRKTLPKMNCVGPQQPECIRTDERTGVSFYAYFCEGCGTARVIPDNGNFHPTPPIFWGEENGGCGCRKRRELTEYFDPCQKKGCPIFLTPGAAMRRKREGASYQQRKEYCGPAS